jgi:ABC-2 type transport system permease protein
MTLMVPVLALLAIGVAKLVIQTGVPTARSVPSIGMVDQSGLFAPAADQRNGPIVAFASPPDAARALAQGAVKEYWVIPAGYPAGAAIQRFTMAKELVPAAATSAIVKSYLTRALLQDKVPPAVTLLVEAPLNVATTRLGATGGPAADQGGFGTAIIPLGFSLLLLLSILFSSGNLLVGLGEEKESRLMEVLISIVSPRELLTGKVLGLGAAGLLQVLVWLASIPLLLALGSSLLGGGLSVLHAPVQLYVLGVVYFLLGYLLVAVLSAGIGAMSSTARDAQQATVAFTLLPVVPLWAMSLFMAFPENPVWIVLSIFPFTAPTMVMERIGMAEVAPWQLAASLVVLAGSVAAAIAIALKSFNAYLLRYGKRPKLSQLMRGRAGGPA